MKIFLDKKFLTIIFIGIILRVFAIYFYGDSEVDNEWAIMLNNLEQEKILSVRSIDGISVPNIFMPPLYPIFLYLIKLPLITSDYYLDVVFLIQLLISVISIYLTHKILLEIFSINESYIGSTLFALFPLNIYYLQHLQYLVLHHRIQ